MRKRLGPVENPYNSCQLCGEPATTTVCGAQIGPKCVATLRAIAEDAGVPIDEELLGGKLRKISRRAISKGQQKLEDAQERREIAAVQARAAGGSR